jgi:transcriptional antiterminator
MTLTLKHLTRLKSLHQIIKSAQTGTPAQLAKSLHISQRTLREDLELVKHWGGEICYDRKNTTYYYCNDFDLKISFDVIAITEGQQQHIYGGGSKNTFVANKLP